MTYHTAIDGQISSTGVNLVKIDYLRPEPQEQELYIQIKDGVAKQIIKDGLSRAESKLFFYLLTLDRFGDRPVKVKVAEVLLGAGIKKTAYHAAIIKFERMGWFGFTHSDVEITNFCTPTKKSAKANSHSANANSYSANANSHSANANSHSANANSEKLKALPVKVSKTPQTIQTYSDLLQTLSEGQRESFKKFCLKKIEESGLKIASKEAWLNKHGVEYLAEFKETYSEALANPETIAPKIEPSKLVDIPTLKAWYGIDWEAAAAHHGYIVPNSPTVEIQEEPEQVASSEVAAKPIADSNNSQELTPAIGAKHKQFAEGDRVVIAEVGNTHHGQAGKVIAVRSGSKEDEYRVALDNESHFVRELSIKIPKGCKFTYLMKL